MRQVVTLQGCGVTCSVLPQLSTKKDPRVKIPCAGPFSAVSILLLSGQALLLL